jgi:hypothetical protein
VVTAILSPESRVAVRELANRHGVELTEWHCEERGLAKQALLSDFSQGELATAGGTNSF